MGVIQPPALRGISPNGGNHHQIYAHFQGEGTDTQQNVNVMGTVLPCVPFSITPSSLQGSVSIPFLRSLQFSLNAVANGNSTPPDESNGQLWIVVNDFEVYIFDLPQKDTALTTQQTITGVIPIEMPVNSVINFYMFNLGTGNGSFGSMDLYVSLFDYDIQTFISSR